MKPSVEPAPALYFKQFGNGDPLIILHGLFGCWNNWYPIAKALSKRFGVFVVDQRNHGRSFHSSRFDYDDLAADVGRFMETQELSRASLLGHSMGGKTALRFAAMFPERVARLVIVDVAHKAQAPCYAAAIEALWELDLGSLERLKQAEECLRPQIPEIGLRLFLLKNLEPAQAGGFRWKVNLEAIRCHYEALCGPVAVSLFMKPCLFIRGGDSDFVRDTDWPEVKRLFPRAELMTIGGAGHWVHVDAKEAVLRAIEAFLARRNDEEDGRAPDAPGIVYNASQGC
jgi:esterase